MKINEDIIFKKNKDVPWRLIEGEAILVDVPASDVIHMNPTASEMWDAIDGKRSVKDIIDFICANYEIDKKIAKEDTIELLKKLEERKLIVAN